MKLAMIGTGYVGLVSGACFADFGHEVVCVDSDAERIARLRRGELTIYEPGLDVLVAGNVAVGRLSFDTDVALAVGEADAVFIAVGTPSRRGDGHADLSYVKAAAQEIATALDGFTLVVTKSTVPVGTGDDVERIIYETRPDAEFEVASSPEFLREGSAIEDFKRPDRVIIGAETERARELLRLIYRPLSLNETPILFTDRCTAELTKYAANALLATKIAFINEMADICERTGANVQHVARGVGLDRRIGPKFLHAGPGYGGSCFPKDTQALARTAALAEAPSRIVEAVIASNDKRKSRMADRVIEACGGSVSGLRIGVLGVTFKPNTDDMREAPSCDIVSALRASGADICAYDPIGMAAAGKLEAFSGVTWCEDAYATMEGADAVVIITEWDQFRALDLNRMRETMRAPVLVDLRNVYTPEETRKAGLRYISVGRAAVDAWRGSAAAARVEWHSVASPVTAEARR
jgi:UDPglucose 6-dehydrogenase